jgi:hypothetical protein
MAHLEIISLSECKIVPRWASAPDGAFLQIRRPNEQFPFVAMKCLTPKKSEERNACILRLCDLDFGRWEGLRPDTPALDVSNKFELVGAHMAPNANFENPQNGFLYMCADGSIFMWAHNGSITGYVCTKGSERYSIGMIYSELSLGDVFELGMAQLRLIEFECKNVFRSK